MLKRWHQAALIAVGVAAVGFAASFFFPAEYYICSPDDYTHTKECTQYHAGPFILALVFGQVDTHNGIVTAIATIAIAWFTLTLRRSTDRLWKASEIQRRDNRKAIAASITAARAARRTADTSAAQIVLAKRDMIISKRPFVFFGKPYRMALYDREDDSKLIGWRLAPVWENAGLTPTRHLRYACFTQYHAGGVPYDFDFPNVGTEDYARSYIGPQSSRQAQHIDWGVETFDAVLAGQGRLLWWGWAEYTDIMESGKFYRTEFCVDFVVERDPRSFEPFPFRLEIYKRFNGTDDECYRQPSGT